MVTRPDACRRKRSYQSDAVAKAAIEAQKRYTTVKLTYYRCGACHRFHLTKDLGGKGSVST